MTLIESMNLKCVLSEKGKNELRELDNMNNKLFITKLILDRDKIENFDEYPFNMKVIKNLTEIIFDSPVTFLIGDNGIGKSTIIKALAVLNRINPEGGTNNFNFSTKDTHSKLAEYLELQKTFRQPKTKFFLRAESFYNVASEIIRNSEESGCGELYPCYGGNLHECSHGESFIKLIKNRFAENGLYILDEPEAALSPERQMSLLCLIDDLVKNGSQFIIATHFPILISYRNGIILDLNNNFKKISFRKSNIYNTYKIYLDNPEYMQDKLFDKLV